MRRWRSVGVVVKNNKQANMSPGHPKNWALKRWSLSQVSIQHAPMDIAHPVTSGNFICHVNSGGLDLTHPCSPLRRHDCSSTVTSVTCFSHYKLFQGGQDLNQEATPLSLPALEEINGSFQPGGITESISKGHLSKALVTRKAAAVFQTALVFSQAEVL